MILLTLEESLKTNSLKAVEIHSPEDLVKLCKEHGRILISMPDTRTEHLLVHLGHWCYYGDE